MGADDRTGLMFESDSRSNEIKSGSFNTRRIYLSSPGGLLGRGAGWQSDTSVTVANIRNQNQRQGLSVSDSVSWATWKWNCIITAQLVVKRANCQCSQSLCATELHYSPKNLQKYIQVYFKHILHWMITFIIRIYIFFKSEICFYCLGTINATVLNVY